MYYAIICIIYSVRLLSQEFEEFLNVDSSVAKDSHQGTSLYNTTRVDGNNRTTVVFYTSENRMTRAGLARKNKTQFNQNANDFARRYRGESRHLYGDSERGYGYLIFRHRFARVAKIL